MGNPIKTVAGGVLGMITQNSRTKQQNATESKFMQKQFENQKELNQQGHDLNYEMWQKTNYPAQMAMMKEAGLNPSMMYGQGGAGGATTGSQGGGAASKGNSAQAMDIGSAIQASLATSQIKVNEAKAEELKANAESTRGEEGTTGSAIIRKALAEVETEGAKKTLLEAQKITESQKSGLTMQQAIKTAEEITTLSRENQIGDATKSSIISEMKEKAIEAELRNEQAKRNIKMTDKELEVFRERLNKEWTSAIGGAIGSVAGGTGKLIKNAVN